MATIDVADAPLALNLTAISKRFGSVRANADVSLRVRAGSIHAIVGENGAGKSTLMSVLYGLYQADSGIIEVFGQRVRIRDSAQAIRLGIGMVHQHFMLVEPLRAIDNVMLGAEPHWLLRRGEAAVRRRLTELMQSTGLRLDLDRAARDLSVGDRQRLEILKALYRDARVLILDEPTAVLTPQETRTLFDVLARLREQGTTVLLVTHKLGEVMALCDRVTVLRAGAVVHNCEVADTSPEKLAQAMVGRQARIGRSAERASTVGAIALQADDLSVSDALDVPRLRSVSITLRAGEIVGIAGVTGNGQGELLELLAGLTAPQAGRLRLGDASFDATARWLDPVTARQLGLAHVPEDRHLRGLVMSFPAWESAVLGYEALPQYSRRGWLRRNDMRAATASMMKRFDVRPPAPDLSSRLFSGGNQQKLILARELGRAPRVLLVGQPTRGVDIGAIEFIHEQIRAQRDAGCAVLLVSSELEEILALADRVLVMNGGRVTGELAIEDCTEERLGLLMAQTDEATA
jgi:simple sugar transport system ATP-binding protein